MATKKPKKPSRKAKAKPSRKAKAKPSRKAKAKKASRTRKPRRDSFSRTLEGKLVGALEYAQDLARRAGYGTRLEVRRPIGKASYEQGATKTAYGRRNQAGQFSWKSLWALIGEYTLIRPISYSDLYQFLKSWDRASLDRRINKFRIARIRIVYSDRGTTDEFSISETFAWSFALGRSMQECDPDTEGSLASRYWESLVIKVSVWLSHEIRGVKRVT